MDGEKSPNEPPASSKTVFPPCRCTDFKQYACLTNGPGGPPLPCRYGGCPPPHMHGKHMPHKVWKGAATHGAPCFLCTMTSIHEDCFTPGRNGGKTRFPTPIVYQMHFSTFEKIIKIPGVWYSPAAHGSPIPLKPGRHVCVCTPKDCLHRTTPTWETSRLQRAADTAGSFVDGGVKGILQIYSGIMVDTCHTLVGVA